MKRALLLLALSGCAATRFLDRGVVWEERDDAPIARPAENPIAVDWSGMRDIVFLPIDRLLALDFGVEAINVNALDEVPQSSWFHDPRRDPPGFEVRPRALTPYEMYWGAARPEDVPVQPLTVVKGKLIGSTRGFVAKDARGVRYLIKLDPPGRPGFATSVEVVVSRLAWACGFRVPAEVEFVLDVRALKVSPAARGKDRWDENVPFTARDLETLLTDLPRRDDGTMLALASRWLEGENIGPFRYFGRRKDDPNDRYAHENRRDVRGFGTFSAWVNNIDTLENNTLDMYERRHVVHYQQDVGGAFGVWAFGPMQYWMGHATYLDVANIFKSIFTLGFAGGRWEEERWRARHEARIRASPELGDFDADDFDPRTWRPTVDNPAFSRQTARDHYWAAKRIALIDEGELRNAIRAGLYAEPIAERVFEVLWARRQRVLRAYLGDVSSLDWFRFDGSRLCFEDLWLEAGLAGPARYFAEDRGRSLLVETDGNGDACVELGGSDGYRVIAFRAGRPSRSKLAPPIRVHIINNGLAGRRVVGIER